MKTLFTFSLVLFSLFVKGDYWTRKADFGGVARAGAVGFSIGSKGYFATGAPFQLGSLSDLWQYDPLANTWSQKASLLPTAMPRTDAVGFNITSKGYICTGYYYTGSDHFPVDLLEYDTTANSWTKKTDFPGMARVGTVGFSIGTKGYIGTGCLISALYNDFWEWDQQSDTWTQKANFGSTLRCYASGFSIGTKGYIVLGDNINDFWEWDQTSNTWTQKANFKGASRGWAVGFSIGMKGYIGTGDTINDFWEWDQSTDIWTRKADFIGLPRAGATGFSIGNKGYIGTGGSFSNQYLSDFYEYTPDSTTAINEPPSSTFQFQLSPNPAHQSLVVSWQAMGEKKVEIRIIDVKGAPLPPKGGFKSPSFGGVGEAVIDVSGFAAGIYFVEATDGRGTVVRKFLKE